MQFKSDKSDKTTLNEELKDESYQKPKATLDNLEGIIMQLLEGEIKVQDLPTNLKPFIKDIQGIPLKPREPEPEECCGSGCSPCVWDIYQCDLEKHQEALKEVCVLIRSKLQED